jgi:hypothetical protein
MTDDRPDLYEILADPPAEFRPAMFWLLNGKLTPDRIRAQIRDMHERGCGGFFLHPMGERFRLGDFIEGIDPPYLSDEYFAMIRVAVEEADALGMYAWLYDEGGWPSGSAQGQVIEGHPEFRATVLTVDGEGDAVARALVGDRSLVITADALDRPDHLNPQCVRRFIDLTHERYAECVGEYFGGTIPGMFTDETSVPGRVGTSEVPWTHNMLAEFERRAGYDLQPYLPILFSDEALGVTLAEHFAPEGIAGVRCDFCEVWTDLFGEAFWQQINDWCVAHDLTHTGHVGGEDTLPQHAASFGHFGKTAGALHAPGVDVIWRQLFPGQENFSFPLLASSVMAQRADHRVPGGPQWEGLVLSESFAVYGFGLTPNQMRWVADYQFMRGVNYLAPMALCYETAGGRFVGTMSHLGEGNPLWEHFDSFADHVATMSAAVRLSESVADVAVYFPVEAAWLGGEAAEQAWRSLRNVTGVFERRQVPWHFIDARTIENAEISGGALDAGGHAYGAIVVPDTPVLRSRTMARLAELRLRGGRVAFCDRVPTVPADLQGRERFRAAFELLTTDAQKMDIGRALAEAGADDARGLGSDKMWIMDGFSAAYAGPSASPPFTQAEIAEGACLVVPTQELPRLGDLLPWARGRFELHMLHPQPELRLASRMRGETDVHLIQNDADDEMIAGLWVAGDHPRIVERWDTLAGECVPIAVHAQISDVTNFELRLLPGECVLLTTRPLEGDPPACEPEVRWDHLTTTRGAESLEIISEWVITAAGDLEELPGSRVDIDTPFPLASLEELGLADVSGTVRYELVVAVPPLSADERLMLDLGEVGYVARVWLGGEELGVSAWPPHRVEITGLVEEGANDLVIEVTNTLANQALSEETLAAAEDQGWMNPYYQRARPFMEESLRSGLIGPVRLLVCAQKLAGGRRLL